MPTDSVPGSEYLDFTGASVLVSFLAMEYFGLMLNRTYAISATKTMVCGAKMFGAVGSPRSALGIHRWRDPRNFIDRKTQDKYRGVSPESPEFLAVNKDNFQIYCADIVGIAFSPKKKLSMGGIPHSGTITLEFKDRKPREFILLGDQDGAEIETKLRSICSNAR
ncbi:MAG: hypothetical protein MUO38_04700 [Anaerolineales bacterium]|nr:hypothetical protein [Anaerolineales bacterium]